MLSSVFRGNFFWGRGGGIIIFFLKNRKSPTFDNKLIHRKDKENSKCLEFPSHLLFSQFLFVWLKPL